MQSGSVLQLLHRLRGGGGDGGATGAESRSSYLEMYMDKKPDKVCTRDSGGLTNTPRYCTERITLCDVRGNADGRVSPAQVNPREAALAKWTRCQLSGEPLHPPCVSDELGHLFNKDAVVNALMERTVPPALAHISRQDSVCACSEHCVCLV